MCIKTSRYGDNAIVYLSKFWNSFHQFSVVWLSLNTDSIIIIPYKISMLSKKKEHTTATDIRANREQKHAFIHFFCCYDRSYRKFSLFTMMYGTFIINIDKQTQKKNESHLMYSRQSVPYFEFLRRAACKLVRCGFLVIAIQSFNHFPTN